jgi:hypothetical protein
VMTKPALYNDMMNGVARKLVALGQEKGEK